MPARRTLPLLAVAATLTVAACSNSESTVNKRPHTGSGTASAVNGVQQIVIRTGNDLRFHPSTITVHPGKVHVVLMNTSTGGAPHNLSVTGLPVAFVPLAVAGQTQSVTFTAPSPGRYKFVCTIHAAQGQNGVLIVDPGPASS